MNRCLQALLKTNLLIYVWPNTKSSYRPTRPTTLLLSISTWISLKSHITSRNKKKPENYTLMVTPSPISYCFLMSICFRFVLKTTIVSCGCKGAIVFRELYYDVRSNGSTCINKENPSQIMKMFIMQDRLELVFKIVLLIFN